MQLTDSIRTLKGIGAKNEAYLNHMGIFTIEELLNHFPRTYITYEMPVEFTELIPDKRQAVCITLTKPLSQIPGGRVPKLTAFAESGGIRLSFLWYRMPYLKKMLHPGNIYIFYGKIQEKNGRFSMEQPEVFTPEQYEVIRCRIQPVYSLTEGVHNKLMIKLITQIFQSETLFEDYLPEKVRSDYHLCEYNYALRQIHFPEEEKKLAEARKRLAFDEFFLFSLAVRTMKNKNEISENIFQIHDFTPAENFINQLPYKLTNAQLRTWEQVKNDFGKYTSMNRLIQGDVGSGKTIIAELALLVTAKAGYQGCLMAPTEVLASQHYETFKKELAPFCIRCLLLTGSMTAKEKRLAYDAIENNDVDIIIGTHAVIQEKTRFFSLGLVVTDEQHRFGVHQREFLSAKGTSPHVIVMSATPIPRTLALILYGDLDISVMDELPERRLAIKNCVVGTDYRPAAYRFIEKEALSGHQIYIICPMVEESEWMDLENVVDYTKKLKKILPTNIHIKMLHGKMPANEKKDIMEAFYKNEIQVLVSTTVIEVGINVPNATVMMVENAERFGLAQLHQLRGRVGRGDAQSYCIFVQSGDSQTAKERLEILNKSNDGFYIAEEDLKMRGPGDLFGLRQSGLMDFRIADLYEDVDLLSVAGECAGHYEENLTDSLKRRLLRYMKSENMSVIL